MSQKDSKHFYKGPLRMSRYIYELPTPIVLDSKVDSLAVPQQALLPSSSICPSHFLLQNPQGHVKETRSYSIGQAIRGGAPEAD